MAKPLGKYKKVELIELVETYEEEVSGLREELAVLTVNLENSLGNGDMEDSSVVKYLKKRIHTIQDPVRRLVYEEELRRIRLS
jgi:hypothetical protein